MSLMKPTASNKQTSKSPCLNSARTLKIMWQRWATGKKKKNKHTNFLLFSPIIFRCSLSPAYLLDRLPPLNSLFPLWSQEVSFQKGNHCQQVSN